MYLGSMDDVVKRLSPLESRYPSLPTPGETREARAIRVVSALDPQVLFAHSGFSQVFIQRHGFAPESRPQAYGICGVFPTSRA